MLFCKGKEYKQKKRCLLIRASAYHAPHRFDGVSHNVVQVLYARPVAADHGSDAEDVSESVHEDAPGGLAVAPGASALLVVVLDRLGQRVVYDEPDVRLVDTHTERDRSDYGLDLVRRPLLVDRAAGGRFQVGVVDSNLKNGGKKAAEEPNPKRVELQTY